MKIPYIAIAGLLLCALPSHAMAQQAAPRLPVAPVAPIPAAPAPPAPAARARAVDVAPNGSDDSAFELRERLQRVLRQYPPSVSQVLRLDTSLLSRPDYLAAYPQLEAFLAQHPEVAHNPRFFVGDAADDRPLDASVEAVRTWRQVIDLIQIVAVVFIITSALTGVIRTLLDQNRWRRATRLQIDMQNKIIDRFSTSTELLSYIQSPVGQTLTGIQAPAVSSASPTHFWDAPLSRIFWPLQAGIVLTAAGAGLMFIAAHIALDGFGQPIGGAGVLAVAIGLGFMASAGASFLLSHRLGLVPPARKSEVAG